MAEDAPGFLDEMDGLGIAVEFVSLLGEGLNNVIGEPTQAAFDAYLSSYGHGGPLLKDRGFGYAMFKPYWDDQREDLGYPTWAIVRPDMTLLHVGKGFSDFEEITGLIVEDASQGRDALTVRRTPATTPSTWRRSRCTAQGRRGT